jgi:aldose sugar dehydrogenase
MTNSAAYVGRVGGLAAALGIGAVVAFSQQVAWADSPDSPSDSVGSASSSASSESSPGSSGSSGTAPGHSPAGPPAGSATANTTSDGSSASGSTATSGGSNLGSVDTDSDPDTDTLPAEEPAQIPPAEKPDVEIADPPKPFLAFGNRARTQALPQADIKPAPNPETQSLSTSSAKAAHVVQTTLDISATTAKVQSTPLDTSLAIVTVDESQPVIVESAPEARASSTTEPQVVTGLLAAVGLSPLATDSPLAPVAPPPTLFGALEWLRREIMKTFFNEAPTIAYNPAENSLVDDSIVGTLVANDPDGTGYTMTATKPAKGEVVLNPDGTFVYTPGPDYNGEDTFDVTVTEADSGFHIHGLGGLINLVTFGLLGESGHSTTRTINVGEGVPPDVPVQFERTTVVSGLVSPTDFRILPDDRILLAEKGGAIKVANADGQLQSEPLITFPVSTVWARGVNAIELDPDYANNGHVYVSYIGDDNIQRLSRITVTDPSADVLAVDPDSLLVLVEGTEPAGNDHHGGGLSFGPDGKLYWSTGDNVCCSVLDGSNSQDLTNMYGKVLRLNPDGTAPEDNPFYDGDGPNYDAIYATGFRNPFRLTFTPEGQLLVTEVGQGTWEEVNLVTAGENYGWPNAEGPCNGIGVSNCATPSPYANPAYAYLHTSGGNSITGVMVYTGEGSVGGSQHTVLIADFNQGWIKQLTCSSDYSSCGNETMFNPAAGKTVSIQQAPDGSIYQLTIDGTLWRIAPSDDGSSDV